MNWIQTVEKFYRNKKSESSPFKFASLLEMVTEQMEEQTLNETGAGARQRDRVLRLPYVIPTEVSVGQKPGSEDRQQFELWMSNLGVEGGGDVSTVAAKIKNITNFFANPQVNLAEATIPQTLSYLMFLNQFVWMLKEFNASVAGFLWEPFLAALFGGKSKQIKAGAGDIADIKIWPAGAKEGESISLKILNEAGTVKGSFTDLVNHFAAGGTSMRYVVVTKQQSKKEHAVSSATFWEFDIRADNFFDWIGSVHYVEKLRLTNETFFLSAESVKKNAFLKMGKSSPSSKGSANYVYIRHGASGKLSKKRKGQDYASMAGARAKWFRLALLDDKKGIIIDSDIAELVNLQGIPEDGIIQPDTTLSADLAYYGAGGTESGQRSVQGATLGTDYVKFEQAPGIFEESKYTVKTWGKEKQDSEGNPISGIRYWSGLAQQLKEEGQPPAEFFRAVQGERGVAPAPGYSQKSDPETEAAQFNITPNHYQRLGTSQGQGKLGVLKITTSKVEEFFKEAAAKMNDDLVLMFNSLADLTDNIGRFFLVDCGGQEASAKCTDKDASDRNQAGKDAMTNAGELEGAVVSSVQRIEK